MNEDIRWRQRLENLSKALSRLREALDGIIVRGGNYGWPTITGSEKREGSSRDPAGAGTA